MRDTFGTVTTGRHNSDAASCAGGRPLYFAPDDQRRKRQLRSGWRHSRPAGIGQEQPLTSESDPTLRRLIRGDDRPCYQSSQNLNHLLLAETELYVRRRGISSKRLSTSSGPLYFTRQLRYCSNTFAEKSIANCLETGISCNRPNRPP